MAGMTPLILVLLFELSDGGTVSEEAKYVGCYPSSIGGFKAQDPLSWKQCLYLCDHRIMTYAAIQAEENAPTYNYCFCTDTLQNLTAVNSSLCRACEDVPDQFCGGNTWVSVYKLAESRPLTLLVGTTKGLEEWRGNISLVLPGISASVHSIDYHYSNDTIFFTCTSYNGLYSSFYSSYSMRFVNSQAFKKVKNYHEKINDVLIDWKSNKCYYTYFDAYRMPSWVLLQTSLTGELENRFELNREVPSSITADFNSRVLFYATTNNLFSLNLVSGEKKTYYEGTKNIKTILKVVADAAQKEVYLIAAEYDDQYYLVKFSYDDRKKRVLLHGSQLSNPQTFDIYENYIVWVNSESSENQYLYGCKLSPRCLVENIETLRQVPTHVNTVKIYHPPITIYKDQCDDLKCSHNCTISPELKAACTCPEPLALNRDNRTCLARARSLDNVTYVGCYPERNIYKVLHSMSWEEVIHFCDHRKAIYAAIQADPRAATFNFPYCSSNLLDNLTAVDSSLCRQCEDAPERYCGGNNTMSVYKLRESYSLTVMMATTTGLMLYSDDTLSVTDMMIHSTDVTGFDFYMLQDEILFISGERLWSTFFSPSSQSYVQSSMLWDGYVKNIGLAVDWVSNKTYFSKDHFIWKADLNGKNPAYAFHRNHDPQDIVVDPYKKLLFWMENNVFYSTDIIGVNLTQYDNKYFFLKKVFNISVDIRREIIYMIGEENEGQFRLVQTDYSGKGGRVLYKGSELATPGALSVWGTHAVWVSSKGGLYTMYSCELSPRCLLSGLRKLAHLSQVIFSIKIYDVEIQTRMESGGQDYFNGYAGSIETPTTTPAPSTRSTKTESKQHVLISEVNKMSEMEIPKPNEHESVKHLSETDSYEDYETTNSFQISKKLKNISEIQRFPVNVTNPERKSSFLDVCFVFGIFLIVIVLLSILYVLLRSERSFSHIGRSFMPSSEIELN